MEISTVIFIGVIVFVGILLCVIATRLCIQFCFQNE